MGIVSVKSIPYVTRLATFRKYPKTMFGSMFSGRCKLDINEDGHHFNNCLLALFK